MLAARQEAILKSIIQDYMKTAQPVGSLAVAQKDGFALSSATVRNEMSELEEQGYIMHPHTSAGRIPTEKGWRYYVSHFLEERPVSRREQEQLSDAYAQGDTQEERTKFVAKQLADLVSTAVFIAFTPHDVYYTGLANLFAQPECAHLTFVRSVSGIIDELDDVLPSLADSLTDLRVLVGKDSPFGDAYGVIVAPIPLTNQSLVGCLGPIRMTYNEHIARIRFFQGLLGDKPRTRLHSSNRSTV